MKFVKTEHQNYVLISDLQQVDVEALGFKLCKNYPEANIQHFVYTFHEGLYYYLEIVHDSKTKLTVIRLTEYSCTSHKELYAGYCLTKKHLQNTLRITKIN